MPSADERAYGHEWWPVSRANWHDLRTGLRSAALARKGYLRPPHGEGKIIWIKAGYRPESVNLACELLAALRTYRLDVRLVLTFERDYPDIIEPRVRGLRKIGLGYGPSDRPKAVKRVMERLDPFGLILVDTQPHPNLLQAAIQNHTHIIAFNTPPTDVEIEASFPVDHRQAEEWRIAARAQYLAEPADPFAVWAESQIDTTFRSLTAVGQDEVDIWWWHDDQYESQSEFIHKWRNASLAKQGILVVSGYPMIDKPNVADLRISQWQRDGLKTGTVLYVDDRRWFGAIASSANGGYINTSHRNIFWQALAGGSALRFGPSSRELCPQFPGMDNLYKQPKDVLEDWLVLSGEPLIARRQGDEARRYFWNERRRVQCATEIFLKRVFDW